MKHTRRAKSRLHKGLTRLQRLTLITALFGVLLGLFIISRLSVSAADFDIIQEASAPQDPTIQYIETIKEVEVIKEIEVDRKFTTEQQQVLAYLVEVFKDDADLAIIMIGTCENSTFAPDRKSPLNIQQSGRRSYDIGVMQINVDENDLVEQKKLTNYKYNIDKGYAKYKAAGNKFTAWTCASKIGQKNYLGQ